MIKAVIFDFGRVLIFPKDGGYFGGLNNLHRVLSESPNYNFKDHFSFNEELLKFINDQKSVKKFETYLFTKGKIKDHVDCQRFLGNTFMNVFSADTLRLKKDEPSTYLSLAEKIDSDPSQVLYVDDSRSNTVAAEKAGLLTITFRNNMQFETEFCGYIM